MKARKLRAVLFADIAGYTAMMQADEAVAARVLEKFEKSANSRVPHYHGKVIQFYGDGVLCVFDNPYDAINCAVDLQGAFSARPEVPVRIGIHMGMVVLSEDKVYGDAVNVAARIQSIAVPGSVFISEKVLDEIANQPEIKLQKMGRFDFKNVRKSMEVYAVKGEGLVVPEGVEVRGKMKKRYGIPAQYQRIAGSAAVPFLVLLALVVLWNVGGFQFGERGFAIEEDTKAIAVLPFSNYSPHEESQYFCDGIMEAIHGHLSEVEGLFVIARASTETYRGNRKRVSVIAHELGVSHILEGAVQRDGAKVRITVRLIEGDSERQLWAENYDEHIGDIFATQTKIAMSIASALQLEFFTYADVDRSPMPRVLTTDVEAYDYYLRGRDHLVKLYDSRALEAYEGARKNFERAIECDPYLAIAYVDLAQAMLMYHSARGSDASGLCDTVNTLARKALELSRSLPAAHSVLARCHLSRGEYEKFEEEIEMALELNPNYAGAYHNLGAYLVNPEVGDFDFVRGMNYLYKAIELDPISSRTVGYHNSLAWAYLTLGDFAKAEHYARKVFNSGHFGAHSSLAHIFVVQGKYAEALEIVEDWHPYSPHAMRYEAEILTNYDRNYPAAIEVFKEYAKSMPDNINWRQRMGLAYWLNGQEEEARACFRQALQEYNYDTDRWWYDIAGIYATTGDTAKALYILSQVEIPETGLGHYSRIDPFFNNLHSNAEFQEILDKWFERIDLIRSQVESSDLAIM